MRLEVTRLAAGGGVYWGRLNIPWLKDENRDTVGRVRLLDVCNAQA